MANSARAWQGGKHSGKRGLCCGRAYTKPEHRHRVPWTRPPGGGAVPSWTAFILLILLILLLVFFTRGGPSEEAGPPQAPRPAELGGQRAAQPLGAAPGALSGGHGAAQGALQLLQVRQGQPRGGARRGGRG